MRLEKIPGFFLAVFLISALGARLSFATFSETYLKQTFPESVTGIISDIRRNSIEIIEDYDKRRMVFTETASWDQWHKGEHVRIDYWPHGNIVEHIQKIRTLEYQKNRQNLGNIYIAP